jgi:hypothetical protein
MSRIASLALIVAALLGFAVAPAFASKSHGGGGGGGGSGTTAQITASPNPAAPNTFVSVTGCGFTFAPAILRVIHPLGTDSYNVAMWSSGCLDSTGFYTAETGTYTVEILQTFGKKHNKTTVLEASTTVTVQ